jgi:Zn-dependent peptidase ImmA (M78 family)
MINGFRVTQAREITRLTQAELASKTNMRQSQIADLESGLMEVTAARKKQIEAIAIATGFSVGFFMQDLPPDVPLGSLLFRCRAKASHSDKNFAKSSAIAHLELIESLAIGAKLLPLHFPRSLDMSASEAAILTRSTLSLSPDRPIKHLIYSLESSGVVVISVPGISEGLDGFSFWSSSQDRRPVVVLAANRLGDRMRFTCAHELGHLVLHKGPSGNLEDLESQAHQFAGEFLMPEIGIRSQLENAKTLIDYARLKLEWGVSMQALIRRSYDLAIIDDKRYQYLFQELSRKKWRKREPENLDIPVEKPRLMMKLAELHWGLPLNLEKIAALKHLPVSLVENYLQHYCTYKELQPKVGKTEQPNRIEKVKPESKVIPFGKRAG